MQEFENKIAVVTGSSGIGLEAALKLAREGARVFIGGINDDYNATAKKATAALDCSVHNVDVAIPAQVAGFINIAVEAGGIDIIVNSAAIQTYGTTPSTDVAHWDRVMAINLRSCYLTAHYAYASMQARGGGAIVHVSSVQGYCNQNEVLAYATAKGGIHALTRAMAVDCAADNIRVNSISPGSIRTPLLEFAAQELAGAGNSIEDTIEQFGSAHPLGRVGTVQETAELIAFLVSDRASFCTGGDYRIDGGLLAHNGVK